MAACPARWPWSTACWRAIASAHATPGEIVVLALLPDFEGRGIGKTLLGLMVAQFSAMGFKRLFLGCSSDPAVRSYGFYRHLGWRPTGAVDDLGDEVLEYAP